MHGIPRLPLKNFYNSALMECFQTCDDEKCTECLHIVNAFQGIENLKCHVQKPCNKMSHAKIDFCATKLC